MSKTNWNYTKGLCLGNWIISLKEKSWISILGHYWLLIQRSIQLSIQKHKMPFEMSYSSWLPSASPTRHPHPIGLELYLPVLCKLTCTLYRYRCLHTNISICVPSSWIESHHRYLKFGEIIYSVPYLSFLLCSPQFWSIRLSHFKDIC